MAEDYDFDAACRIAKHLLKTGKHTAKEVSDLTSIPLRIIEAFAEQIESDNSDKGWNEQVDKIHRLFCTLFKYILMLKTDADLEEIEPNIKQLISIMADDIGLGLNTIQSYVGGLQTEVIRLHKEKEEKE